MVRRATSLAINPAKFAFLSKQVGAAALNSDTSASQDKAAVSVMPSWNENLWPMDGNRLSATVCIDSKLPVIPATDLSNFINTGARTYIVGVESASSYLIVGLTKWLVLDDGAWYDLRVPSSATSPAIYSYKRNTDILDPGTALLRFDPTNTNPNEFQGLEDLTSSLTLPSGITIGDIVGACASRNYRILVTTSLVMWSAPLNDVYFETGGTGANALAGFAEVDGITSPINYVLGTENGFYIFTNTNIIRATYTENPNSPWRFRVLPNSTGVLSTDHLLVNEVRENTFIWSNTGFATLGSQGQTLVTPELTELLAGDIEESFNTATKKIDVVSTGNEFELQIAFTGKRTIGISYGQNGQVRKYILIYDLVTQRWGRLNIDHVTLIDVFKATTGGLIFDDWTQFFEDTLETFASMFVTSVNPQLQTQSIGVIKTDGTICRLTPIDIYTGLENLDDVDFEILGNALVIPNLKLTRRGVAELNEVILHNGYKTYELNDVANSATVVAGQNVAAFSDIEPTALSYLIRDANSQSADIVEYVNTIQGNDITIVLENVNSLIGVEPVLKPTGRKWL